MDNISPGLELPCSPSHNLHLCVFTPLSSDHPPWGICVALWVPRSCTLSGWRQCFEVEKCDLAELSVLPGRWLDCSSSSSLFLLFNKSGCEDPECLSSVCSYNLPRYRWQLSAVFLSGDFPFLFSFWTQSGGRETLTLRVTFSSAWDSSLTLHS